MLTLTFNFGNGVLSLCKNFDLPFLILLGVFDLLIFFFSGAVRNRCIKMA